MFVGRKLDTTGTTRPSLNTSIIENIPLPIPNLRIQKFISKLLSSIDQKIELNQKMNKVLEEIAQTIFRSWFIDFEPFKDGEFEYNEEVDKEIPKGWEVGTLKEVISIYDSKRIPLSKIERKVRKGIYPYYGAASILDYIDDYIFDGIFLLMAEDGSVIDNNEKPILQYVHGKFWANNHVHVIQGKNEFCTEFVMLHLMNINIRPYITGAVQLKINQSNLFRIPIIKPDKTTLLKFREIIDPIFEKIRKNKDEINILIKLRDILLPQLISGRLRITNIEKFLAEIDYENN
ncbi:MAG: restriction endonuclease subunit S [Candidatus Heimdallarchaeum aukensis]|uniref:Restriction endonuclease subunit S n=1 Tax=Candidatus Heimdallarchaeum aukensis TaxID=2876573 RepID=A0A9Y1BNL5_9ARCH|nr:MAG: restriction endonuclease subunit S [Candidatus Heimdallarchaeum aukensis]